MNEKQLKMLILKEIKNILNEEETWRPPREQMQFQLPAPKGSPQLDAAKKALQSNNLKSAIEMIIAHLSR